LLMSESDNRTKNYSNMLNIDVNRASNALS